MENQNPENPPSAVLPPIRTSESSEVLLGLWLIRGKKGPSKEDKLEGRQRDGPVGDPILNASDYPVTNYSL